MIGAIFKKDKCLKSNCVFVTMFYIILIQSLLALCVIVIFNITYNSPLKTREITTTKSLLCITRTVENKCNSNSTIYLSTITTQMKENITYFDRKRNNTIIANFSNTIAHLQDLNFSTNWNRTIHTYTEKLKAITAVKQYRTNTTTKMAYYKGQHIIADFQDFYNVTSDHLQDPLLNKHQFQLTLNNKEKCKGKDVFLCVFIHSATYDIHSRQMIRSTWGSVKEFRNKHIEYVFILGQTQNMTMNIEIQKESSKFMDIVQGNFDDTYKNLTYKHVLGLYWINKFCNHTVFIIKIDSDVMVNMPLLVKHLESKSTLNNNTNIFECKFCLSDGAERGQNNKWFISYDMYPFSKYPPYCIGLAVIMTYDVVIKFIEATRKVPFFWVDDVYVGGFLPWITGVEINEPEYFSSHAYANLTEKPLKMFYLYEHDDTRHLFWNNAWKQIVKYENNVTVPSIKVVN